MVAGQGATATIWTPDLLQTLAQGRQVTVFTNKCLGLSVDSEETQPSSVEGNIVCKRQWCSLQCMGAVWVHFIQGQCLHWTLTAVHSNNAQLL